MSFILDALKKSEIERQRQIDAGIDGCADVVAAQPSASLGGTPRVPAGD